MSLDPYAANELLHLQPLSVYLFRHIPKIRFQICRAGDYSILIRRLPPPFGPSTGAFYPGFTRMDSRP
nr:MAG TPA: hypothetical protein [Caudoviricetes sp.]